MRLPSPLVSTGFAGVSELVDHVPVALRRPVRAILAVLGWFVCIASLIMAFTFFFVVILRYGFNADLFAYEEWLLIICFWLYFMASALGTYENSHVNANLLDYVSNSQRLNWLRAIVVCCIEIIVSLAVVYWAVLMLRDEISSYPYWQSTIAMKIPFLIPRIAVLLGFVLMTFFSSLRLYVLLHLGATEEQLDARRDADERVSEGG